MENRLQEKKTHLIRIFGIGLVIVVAAVSITLFFTLRRPSVLNLSQYVSVGKNSSGETAASVDLDAILSDLHYPVYEDRADLPDRFPEVRALMEMKLHLSSADDTESVLVTAEVDTETLLKSGIRIQETSWNQQIKGQIASSGSPVPSRIPSAASSDSTPVPDFTAGIYLTSLSDENGDGYNLRAICERVQKERDDLCQRILGDSFSTEKLQVTFSVGTGDSSSHNIYQASYHAMQKTEEAQTPAEVWFRVQLFDLCFSEDGNISFSGGCNTVICSSESECKRAPSSKLYSTVTLSGGGVKVSGKPAFDQNGFVIFPGQPTSYRMASGLYWSPTYDALTEDMIWKLTALDGFSLAKLLRYARKEIYARYHSSFDEQTEREFHEHYSSYEWYRESSVDRSIDMTETERTNIRLLRDIQSLIEK